MPLFITYPPEPSGLVIFVMAVLIIIGALGFPLKIRYKKAGKKKRYVTFPDLLIIVFIAGIAVTVWTFYSTAHEQDVAYDKAVSKIEDTYDISFNEEQRTSIKDALQVDFKGGNKLQHLGDLNIGDLGDVDAGFTITDWKGQKEYKMVYVTATFTLYYNNGTDYVSIPFEG